MNIDANIDVEVHVAYREIDGLRFTPGSWSDKEAEWHTISAKASVNHDGTLHRSVWIRGRGHFVKKDGTVGLNPANMQFGSLSNLPEAWQERIIADLTSLAKRVTVSA